MNLRKLGEHRSWLISAGMAALILLWLLSGAGDPTDKDMPGSATGTIAPDEASEAQSSVRVRTQTAEEVQRTIIVNGQTAPARIVELSAETDGRVVELGAERGSNVDEGGLLVRLDERDRQARLLQAQAMLTQRTVEYEARESLKSSSYVSEAQLKEALAALEAARTEVVRAELDLDYTAVRAPFDGALQARAVEVGDFVKSGDPLATFVDNRTIIVTGDVSEFDAGHVQVGDPGEARLATGETVRGTIRYVAPVADSATRTFAVELQVDNRAGQLRAGGTAELRIPAETVLAHRISPSLLTLDDEGNVGVKIINSEGEVEFVEADIAIAEANGIWVAGLPPTATIITVGQGFVPDGAVVNAVPEGEVDTAVAIQSETD
jgi:membrane fusion protein, multidrug efflux system